MLIRRRLLAALPAALLLALASPAGAAEAPVPVAGTVLSGSIRFPRPQGMTLSVDAHDPSRATAALGFDGRCTGGVVGELWASHVRTRETVRIRHGRFSGRLTGTVHHVGGISGRTGSFTWKLSGRFTDAAKATATVSGTARLRMRGHVVAHCRIAGRAPVKLAPAAPR